MDEMNDKSLGVAEAVGPFAISKDEYDRVLIYCVKYDGAIGVTGPMGPGYQYKTDADTLRRNILCSYYYTIPWQQRRGIKIEDLENTDDFKSFYNRVQKLRSLK